MATYSKGNKLLQVSYDLTPASVWGVAPQVDMLVDILAKHYDVGLASRSMNSANPRVTITSTPASDRHLIQSEFQPFESYVDFDYLMAWNHLLARRMIAAYGDDGPETVHNHTWMTFPAASEVAKHYGASLVSSLHFLERQYLKAGNMPTQPDFQDILDIERRIMEESDKLVVFGPNHERFVIEDYGCIPQKISVIPHGVKTSPYLADPSSEPVNVVFAGRLVPEKGIIELLEAIQDLHQKHPQVKLKVLGDGYIRGKLEDEYASDYIEFPGFMAQEDMHKEFGRSQVFCSPSRSDTFGLATLEAASAGLPIVMSKGKSVEELLSSDEAVLIDLGEGNKVDKGELVAQLDAMVGDPIMRASFGAKALQASKRYSVEKMREQYLELCSK